MTTLAAYVTELGPPERIEVGQLPVSPLGPTDVLVRTEVLAVDQVDTLVRSGRYKTPTPFPFIIGRDLVGTVMSRGPGAVGFAEGDRVWCNSLGHGGRQGSFAQEVVVAAERLYHLPDGVDPEAAAAVAHTAATAWIGLSREARLRAEETIIVGGGGGGVGSAAVQMAAASGARVVATAAEQDFEWCRAAGARQVVDYHDHHMIAKLADVVPQGADVYWDTSGHQDLQTIIPLLARGGRVLVTAARSQSTMPAEHYYTHDIRVLGFVISNASVSDLAAAAKAVNVFLADGTLRPRIGARLPLTKATEAHRRQEAGDTGGGRILVTPR
ncbi:MAG: NADPH:quinone reductase [Streptosporangiaceae bacterium]